MSLAGEKSTAHGQYSILKVLKGIKNNNKRLRSGDKTSKFRIDPVILKEKHLQWPCLHFSSFYVSTLYTVNTDGTMPLYYFIPNVFSVPLSRSPDKSTFVLHEYL